MDRRNKILYEGKKRKIYEIENDHIHLDDGTVIHNNEIIKDGKNYMSLYSQKKDIEYILNGFKDIFKKFQKYIKR